MSDTTRQHPRTLGQAFPRTTLYACAVERPARRHEISRSVVYVALAIGFVVAILAAVGT